ncbi:CHAT domain-containing protein [Nemania sp. FL0031]|nr:CHAT domain-containing protein [Nemania sp. FL0031]
MEHRTYLWSHLVFDDLGSYRLERTKGFIDSIVQKLPSTVDGVYESILTKPKDQEMLLKILQIMLAAMRPLTLKEMQVALKTTTTSKPTEYLLENDNDFKDTLRNYCGLFICVHAEKIYFLHQTAKEFLIWKSSSAPPTTKQWKQSVRIRDAHTTLTKISEDYQGLSRKLDTLSRMLGDCYLRTYIVDVLEVAVGTTELAVSAMPEDHPDLTGYLKTRSIQLGTRFDRTGVMHDLRRAIGYQHGRRFERTGSVNDLNYAIDVTNQAIDALPPDYPDLAGYLNNLGVWLSKRFERTGSIDDLDHAIKIANKAVMGTTTIDPVSQAIHLSNLGVLLGKRFDRTDWAHDLDHAIDAVNMAVDITPEDHLSRASYLSNLGRLLGKRFERTNSRDDLAHAIDVTNKAVDMTPEGHVNRARYLSSLGNLLGQRYKIAGSTIDLDHAIEIANRAKTGSMDDLNCALSSYEAGWRCRTAPPSVRIRQAWAAANILASQQNWQESSQLLQEAVNFLSATSPRSLKHTDKQAMLADFAGLASIAAATALNSGKSAYDALQLLELGRGVIASSLIDMRGNISELKQKHPSLAAEFVSFRDELDLPTNSQTLNSSNVSSWVSQAARRREADQKFSELIIRIRHQPGFDNFLLPPTENELMRMADQGPIIVINMSSYRCDAFFVERNLIGILELPGLTLDEVRKRVADLQSRKSMGSSHNMAPLLEWLWDTICCPVLNTLGFKYSVIDGNWPRVWWIPTGLLSQLPLHAAGYHHTNSSGATVLDRVMSSYASSIKALMHGRRHYVRSQPGGDSALLISTPKLPSLPSLPGTTTEINILRDLCLPLGLNAITPPLRKRDVLQHLQTCKLFHFAGYTDPNRVDPSKSSLLLEDRQSNRLTVEDLRDLKLQNNPPFLAYLSAALTGATHAERLVDEEIHLISAFQLAGFRHVVRALWNMSDEDCVTVARVFYETLAQEGMTDLAVCRGLHRAVRELRDTNTRSLVFGWVPYVLFGV